MRLLFLVKHLGRLVVILELTIWPGLYFYTPPHCLVIGREGVSTGSEELREAVARWDADAIQEMKGE